MLPSLMVTPPRMVPCYTWAPCMWSLCQFPIKYSNCGKKTKDIEDDSKDKSYQSPKCSNALDDEAPECIYISDRKEVTSETEFGYKLVGGIFLKKTSNLFWCLSVGENNHGGITYKDLDMEWAVWDDTAKDTVMEAWWQQYKISIQLFTSGTAKWLLRNCYHISLEIMKTTLWMFRNHYGVMWLSPARKGQNLVCSLRSHGITCVERGILSVVSTYFLWNHLALPWVF